MHLECEALARSLLDVFQPNFMELVTLLDAAAANEDLAVELVQNMHDDSVRRRFNALTTQRLHNYLASTMSLVEHVRRLMRRKEGRIAQEFAQRRTDLLVHDEVPFMMDLRVYTQHRALPLLNHSFTISAINTPEQTFQSEIRLPVDLLVEWNGWKAASRRFQDQVGEVVVLQPVVRKHGELVFDLNRWLHDELSAENALPLEDVNRLVTELNAVMLDVPLEEAQDFTSHLTWMRQQPRPQRAPDVR